ncbi:MAG: DinB family protein [Bacteroidetes bacterium]|nr:MAG: DinB family protein [Bacteroidota bacterium]
MHPTYAKLLERLDAGLNDLLESLSGLTDEQINAPAPDGGWSIAQVMLHLMVAEELSVKYIRKKLSFNPKLEKAGLKAALRRLALIGYLKTPLKFKAPKGVDATSWSEPVPLEELRERWLKARAELRILLEELPSDTFDKELYKHPLVGKLPVSAMLEFYQVHFERHLGQIRRQLAVVSQG